MAFLSCFAIATSPLKVFDDYRNSLLTTSIVLGAIHLIVEVRQFIWKPLKYTKDIWNYFGAYFLAIVTSILWLRYNNPPLVQLISASNLLLDLRLVLFLRVFKHFGVYFAIIIGVAKKVFWFLVIIFIIILSFSRAFFLLLTQSRDDTSTLDSPVSNDDPNNPWNLVNKYYIYFANNDTYNQDLYLVQQPDGNTNMFSQFPSSILAINEIENYNTKEAFFAQKAKIITEIELFYLFPNQRRWRNWFPDILRYDASIDDIHRKINEADNSNEGEEYLPYISNNLRQLAGVPEKTEAGFDSRFQQIEDNFEKSLNKIKNSIENNMKEMENRNNDQMQILLNEIKNLKKN
ncbi:14437_t:CDS:2 [Entrophospora sp. SA101]|nr:14437_t:CDS:2 [Entrophospora sp. SA101]